MNPLYCLYVSPHQGGAGNDAEGLHEHFKRSYLLIRPSRIITNNDSTATEVHDYRSMIVSFSSITNSYRLVTSLEEVAGGMGCGVFTEADSLRLPSLTCKTSGRALVSL